MRADDRDSLYQTAVRAYRQGASLSEFEREARVAFLQASLDLNSGNQTQAARMIGTHRAIFGRAKRRRCGRVS